MPTAKTSKPSKAFPLCERISAKDAEIELITAGVPAGGLPGWECTRAFNWWVVKGTPGLPLAAARELHTAHKSTLLPFGQTKVRDVSEFANARNSIPQYHARSPESLKALVDAITKTQAKAPTA